MNIHESLYFLTPPDGTIGFKIASERQAIKCNFKYLVDRRHHLVTSENKDSVKRCKASFGFYYQKASKHQKYVWILDIIA